MKKETKEYLYILLIAFIALVFLFLVDNSLRKSYRKCEKATETKYEFKRCMGL